MPSCTQLRFAAWPQVARERTARSASAQLVQRPLLTGGYVEQSEGPGLDTLREALTGLPDDAAPVVQSDVEDALRSLGYVE